MRKEIIREGDKVRVTEPIHAINRVGYPLHYLEVDIEKMDDGPLKEFAKTIDGWDKDGLLDAIRKTYVRQKGFGGRERTVTRRPDIIVAPGIYNVTATQIRQTGTYVPGSSGWELGDYDPAYLMNAKTVKLLRVTHEDTIFESDNWILSTECEKLKPHA